MAIKNKGGLASTIQAKRDELQTAVHPLVYLRSIFKFSILSFQQSHSFSSKAVDCEGWTGKGKLQFFLINVKYYFMDWETTVETCP